jgi:hypothetical protein
VLIMLLVGIAFGFAYHRAAINGIFAPTAPALMNNAALAQKCRPNWTQCKDLPPEYASFNPWIYATENSLPVIDFGQRKDWAPRTRHDDGSEWTAGYWVRAAAWVHIVLGWAGGLLLAGILSGLIKRE